MSKNYSDFSEDEIQIIESLGFLNAVPILERVQNERADKTKCMICGEPFSDVLTESKLSGVCDKCFKERLN